MKLTFFLSRPPFQVVRFRVFFKWSFFNIDIEMGVWMQKPWLCLSWKSNSNPIQIHFSLRFHTWVHEEVGEFEKHFKLKWLWLCSWVRLFLLGNIRRFDMWNSFLQVNWKRKKKTLTFRKNDFGIHLFHICFNLLWFITECGMFSVCIRSLFRIFKAVPLKLSLYHKTLVVCSTFDNSENVRAVIAVFFTNKTL